MSSMPYIKVYKDFLEIAEALDAGARGRLFLAILQYANGIEFDELTGAERIAFLMVKGQIDRDNERNETTSEARAAAGKKGAESRWQNSGKNSKCHLPYGKNGYNKDKDKDKDKDNNPPIIPPGGWPGVEKGPLLDALRGYEDMRKRQNVPLEDDDKPILLDRLKTLSNQENEWVAMLKKATLCRWKSVYPLKEDEKPKPERMDDLDEFF